MTTSVALFQRAVRIVAAAILTCLAFILCSAPLRAQPAPLRTQTPTNSNRFLFIIDTSASMKPFEKGVQASMFDLISSGVRGAMTNGDTYGIWLVNGENDMSFKMEVWRDKFKVEMGARAALHVKEHGYSGKLNLTQAVDDALAVIRGVGDLTVIFISNGETPLSHTPFDDAINVSWRQLAPVMKQKKTTINTVFGAQDGKLIAWAVNSPDYVIQVPYLPPKPKPKVTTPTVVIAALPRPANPAQAVMPAEPARPRTNLAPIIITKDLVAQERRQFLAMASTLTNEPASTNPAPNQTAATTTTATTNGLIVRTNPAMTSISSNGLELKPVASVTNPPGVATPMTLAPAVTSTVATLTKPEATNVATVSVLMPPATAAPAPVNSTAAQTTESNSGLHPLMWAAIGAGIAVVCMLSVLMVTRARRPEPSLVSQAIIRERMRTS